MLHIVRCTLLSLVINLKTYKKRFLFQINAVLLNFTIRRRRGVGVKQHNCFQH